MDMTFYSTLRQTTTVRNWEPYSLRDMGQSVSTVLFNDSHPAAGSAPKYMSHATTNLNLAALVAPRLTDGAVRIKGAQCFNFCDCTVIQKQGQVAIQTTVAVLANGKSLMAIWLIAGPTAFSAFVMTL